MKMKQLAFSLVIALLWLLPGAQAVEHTKDTLQMVKQRLANKHAVLLDVREQREWDAGHLKLAKLAPLSKLSSKKARPKLVAKLDHKKIIYCHCKSGGRAMRAADYLHELGYDVRPLKWGYQDLVKAGFQVAPPEEDAKKKAGDH